MKNTKRKYGSFCIPDNCFVAGRFPPYNKELIDWYLNGRKPEGFRLSDEISAYSEGEMLVITAIGNRYGWENIPDKIIPVVRGVNRYHHMFCLHGLNRLKKVVAVLHSEKIPVMLIKGLALRLYYLKGVPRIMNDYDLAVEEKNYDRALRALKKAGFKVFSDGSPHHLSVDLDGKILEIHRWIFKHHGEEKSDIWEKALNIDLCGVSCLVPDFLDMFILHLDTRSRDLFYNNLPGRETLWIRDTLDLIGNYGLPEMKDIRKRSFELGVPYSTARMLLRLSRLKPDVVDEKAVKREFSFSREYFKWLESGEGLRRICSGSFASEITWISGFKTKASYHLAQYRFFKEDYRQRGVCFSIKDYFMMISGIQNVRESFFSDYLLERIVRRKDGIWTEN